MCSQYCYGNISMSSSYGGSWLLLNLIIFCFACGAAEQRSNHLWKHSDCWCCWGAGPETPTSVSSSERRWGVSYPLLSCLKLSSKTYLKNSCQINPFGDVRDGAGLSLSFCHGVTAMHCSCCYYYYHTIGLSVPVASMWPLGVVVLP